MSAPYNVTEWQLAVVAPAIDTAYTYMIVALLSTICMGESSPNILEQHAHLRAKQSIHFVLHMRLKHRCAWYQIWRPQMLLFKPHNIY